MLNVGISKRKCSSVWAGVAMSLGMWAALRKPIDAQELSMTLDDFSLRSRWHPLVLVAFCTGLLPVQLHITTPDYYSPIFRIFGFSDRFLLVEVPSDI